MFDLEDFDLIFPRRSTRIPGLQVGIGEKEINQENDNPLRASDN